LKAGLHLHAPDKLNPARANPSAAAALILLNAATVSEPVGCFD